MNESLVMLNCRQLFAAAQAHFYSMDRYQVVVLVLCSVLVLRTISD